MTEQEETAFEQGIRAGLLRTLRNTLSQLGYSDDLTVERMLLEREEAVMQLRDVCRYYGDNDWEPNLHLGDVIDKHLHSHLARPHEIVERTPDDRVVSKPEPLIPPTKVIEPGVYEDKRGNAPRLQKEIDFINAALAADREPFTKFLAETNLQVQRVRQLLKDRGYGGNGERLDDLISQLLNDERD